MDKESNEQIKQFKKTKGTEYTDAVKKRKSDNAGGNQRSPKKGKFTPYDKKHKPGSQLQKLKTNELAGRPDWNVIKREHKDKKNNKIKRKVGGDELFESYKKATGLWEEMRNANCTKIKRSALCKDMAQLFYGNVITWMKQAGGIRMIDHLIVYGDAEIRKRLFDEINRKELILDITKDIHLQHFILKILKHGTPEQRSIILAAFDGHIVRLTKHSIASKVIELAYGEFATAPQRAAMMQEFFGPTFRYFKEEDVKSLTDAINKFPNKKQDIMKDLQKGLQAILQKDIFDNSIILSLLREYLVLCDAEERTTLIDSLQDGLLRVVHTKDGSRIACFCLWHGSSKQRKVIIKSFKEKMFDVATWDHANIVLMAAMDCVDDTKFLAKAVLDVLMLIKDNLFENENGLKVFRYMVLGRDSTFFHPLEVAALEQGDNNPFSKKDAATRRREILMAIAPKLTDAIVMNIAQWSRDKKWTLFLGAAINVLPTLEYKRRALEALAKMCGEGVSDDENSLMDVAQSVKMINYVISNDIQNKKEKMPLFSLMLHRHAKENLVKWLESNRGCFVAVRMMETGIGRVVVATRELVASHVPKLKKMKPATVGAKILLQKMEDFKDVVESEDEEDVNGTEDTSVEDETMEEEKSADEVEEKSADEVEEDSADEVEEDSADEVEEDSADEVEEENGDGDQNEQESGSEEDEGSDEEENSDVE